jgi:chromosome partitioning protein
MLQNAGFEDFKRRTKRSFVRVDRAFGVAVGVCRTSDPAMPNAPEGGSRGMPHVVVVGNQKGGCGKSTLAMHMIVALRKAGKRVAAIDLDLDQGTLTRYIDNRRSWAEENRAVLEMPDHCSMADEPDGSLGRNYAVDLARFMSHLQTIEHDQLHDFIIIDTPGGLQKLAIVAHGIADTIITPINDSLLDLDVIVKIDRADRVPQPSNYSRMVARARESRKRVCGLDSNWIVVRNRMGATGSRNERQVSDVLDYVREPFGFRSVLGLRERVIFRELFPAGLTVFDPIDIPDIEPAHREEDVQARSEIYRVLGEAQLLDLAAMLDEASGGDPEEPTAGDALIRFAPPGLRLAAASLRARRSISRRRLGK